MIDLVENETRNFKTLKGLRSFLKEEDSDKKERLVEFANWEMGEEGLGIKNKKGKFKTYPMRDSGMKTLLKTFQMPVKFYYKKSPTDMLVRDINRMRDEFSPDSEMLVFIQNKEVRAVTRPNIKHVATHATLLDNCELNKNIFQRGSYSDYGLRITTSDEAKPIKVAKGDIINMGIELMYSDVGFFPTSGAPFLNRLICTNGLVIKEKNPLLTSFSMSFGTNMTEQNFLSHLNGNIKIVEADSGILKNTFRAMKDNSIKALPMGEAHARKIRSAIGIDKFDDHERLTKKVMIDEKEEHAINLDLELYSLLDITTRMAKGYDYLNRRRIESLAGGLVLLSADSLLN